MKKILLLAGAVVAGILIKKKVDQGREEQALWQQATDPVEKA
ncbi:DLW-39 family protein [Marmoricola sp. RAF53]